MTRWMLVLLATLALVPLRGSAAPDDRRDDQSATVTVAFGAGMNTAVGMNSMNHHVIPRTVEVKAGGVVNFVVAGFHQIFVYVPGVTPDEVLANAPAFGPPAIPVTPDNLFIDYGIPVDPSHPILFYVGLNPGNANPSTPPLPMGFSNDGNRVEPVWFPEPGRYLVICNVNPHFRDGMWAWVKVTGKGGDKNDN
jgi:plastocyanin